MFLIFSKNLDLKMTAVYVVCGDYIKFLQNSFQKP